MVLAPVVRGRKGEYGKLFEELRAEGFTRVKVDGELRRLEEEIVARQEVQARHRGRGGPARDAAGPAQAAGGLGRDGGRRWPRGSWRSSWCDSGESDAPTPSASPACNCGTSMPELEPRMFSLQLAARRLPALHRARLADGDRPGAGRAGPVAVARRGGDPAVVHQRVELLRADDPGDRRQVRDRHATRPGRTCPRRCRTASCTARTASASTSRTATVRPPPLVHGDASRASSPTSSAATGRPTRTTRARRSRSTCRCGRARSASGARLRPESLAVKVGGLGIHEFTRMSAQRAIEWLDAARADRHRARRSRG